MKNLSVVIGLMMALSLISLSSEANSASWVKWLDCYDGHGNQMVVDIDVMDNSNLQMVLRPASYGSPNVIEYLRSFGLVYSQSQYNEIVIPIFRGHVANFEYSDPFMTHLIHIDNDLPNKFGIKTGALLEVMNGSHRVNWYFNTCHKHY